MKKLLLLGLAGLFFCQQVPAGAANHCTNSLRVQHKQKIESIKKTRDGRETLTLIKKYSRYYGVDYHLVNGLVMVESCYNKNAKSSCGAVGVMQLEPNTAKAHGCHNVYNKEQNIKYGTKHLAGLLAKYKGNESLAIAAYNYGGGNSYLRERKLPPGSQGYVKRVKLYKKFSYELSI